MWQNYFLSVIQFELNNNKTIYYHTATLCCAITCHQKKELCKTIPRYGFSGFDFPLKEVMWMCQTNSENVWRTYAKNALNWNYGDVLDQRLRKCMRTYEKNATVKYMFSIAIILPEVPAFTRKAADACMFAGL